MCNIAGYVGKRKAMPILIEMMAKEEGWDAGFFTGYATVSEGKLYSEKVIGDLQALLDQTNAAEAPGTIGFIHSRTPGSKLDNVEYAHPFFGEGERHAYILNGTRGVFDVQAKAARNAQFERLCKKGHHFRSAMPAGTLTPAYNGMRVHASEVFAHLCSEKIDEGVDPVLAMENGFMEMPKEAVLLMLTPDYPDRIFWSKTNYPMFGGVADHGIYLATTPQVFPEDVQRIVYLDHMAGGEVYKDRFTTKFFASQPMKMATITPAIWKKAYETCEELVKTADRKYPELERAVRALFPEDELSAEAPVVYSILNEWERSGKIRVVKGTVPGQLEGTTAPKFYAQWVK